MAVITLTTDFGIRDHYLASLKGKLLSLCPGCTIVDVSHELTKFEILEASFVIGNCWRDFPEGTIHLLSVNASGPRQVHQVAIKAENHYFVGPDNGIFSLFLKQDNIEKIVLLKSPEAESPSFPAKEILASAAVRLANGEKINSLGEGLDQLIQKRTLEAFYDSNSINGRVIYLDSYENAIVNISKELFEKVSQNRSFTISLRPKRGNYDFGPSDTSISSISNAYGSVDEGEIVAFFNNASFLEIAINKGNAGGLLGLKPGELIRIEFE